MLKSSAGGTVPAPTPTKVSMPLRSPAIEARSCCISGGRGLEGGELRGELAERLDGGVAAPVVVGHGFLVRAGARE